MPLFGYHSLLYIANQWDMTGRCVVLYGNDTFNVKIERRCEIRGIALRLDDNDDDILDCYALFDFRGL